MNNEVSKKANLIVCFILVMTTLCGCSVVGNITDVVNRKKEIETTLQKVMQCIVDKNKTNLLTFFSPDALNNHSQEIYPNFESAFDFINGKIVSYEYAGIYGEEESIDYGKVKYFHCSPKFRNVITDTGFKYEIKISFFHTWEEKPEREGVAKIEIIDAENYKNRVGIGFFYSDNE